MYTVEHWNEQRGVSPVIGVVLMVAITVLLAATTASFLIGLQEESLGDGSPTVAIGHEFDVEGNSDVLEIRHTGGEFVTQDTLRVVVANARCTGGRDPSNRYTPAALGYGNTQLAAGARLVLSKRTLCRSGGDLDLSPASVTVSWVSEDGRSSSVLWRWNGPLA